MTNFINMKKLARYISDSQTALVAVIILGVLAAAWFLIFLLPNIQAPLTTTAHTVAPMRTATVMINGQNLSVEVAETDTARYQGLSGRESLCSDCGMLFNFSDSGQPSFVMRDMLFPLDIIFISQGVVKNIAAQLQPEGSDPKNIYRSSGLVDQVLEVNGGYCDKYDIKPGDSLWIK